MPQSQGENLDLLRQIRANTDTLRDGAITIDASDVNIGNVDVLSSALPSGAATSAKQDTGNTSLASIDAKLTNPLPVSGTVTATPTGTQNVDPVANTIGLATGAKQDLLLTELQLKADLTETQPVGGNVASGAADSGNPVKTAGVYNSTKPTFTTGQRGDAQLTTRGAMIVTLAPTDSAGAASYPTPADTLSNSVTPLATGGYNYLFNGTTWDRLRGDITNGLDVDVTRSVLPTGAATDTLQTTGNASLSSIDTKTPALGQALAAASSPVVLTAAQVTTLTPPAAITGFATLTEQQTQTTALQLIDDTVATDGAATPTKGILMAGQDGTNAQTLKTDATGSLQVDVESSALPTGAATAALQTQPGVDIGDVTINNAAGVSAVNIQDGGNSITVDGAVTTSGTVTEANSGSILTAVQLLDDTVKTLGTDTYTEATTKGSVIGAVRRDANTSLVDTTNEVAPLQVNATGELKVAQIQALPAGTNNIGDVDVITVNGVAPAFGSGVRGATVQRVTVATDDVVPVSDNSGSLTVDAPTGTPVNVQIGNATLQAGVIDETGASAVDALAVGGGTAHDAVDSGNPQKIGGRAFTAPATGVAANDRVNGMFDIYGKQIVRESLREDLGNQQTKITSSTTETTIATADATYKLDLYALYLTNTSATATKVTIRDSTAGTVRFVFYVPAGDMRGFTLPPSGAHKQNAINTAWTATCGTSVADMEITAMWTRSL